MNPANLLTVFIRTAIFYFVVLILVRIMGKREVGQLSPFDLVVSIMIAEAAVFPIEDPQKSMWMGLIPIITLSTLQITISILCLSNSSLQALINGRPAIIIENGKIKEKTMRKNRYSIHDLMEQLRQNQTPSLKEVQYAVLEMSGKLSVLPKAEFRGLKPSDMGISVPEEGLPAALVVDGEVNRRALKALGKDERWLENLLEEQGIRDVGELLVAALNRDGTLWLQSKRAERSAGNLF